MTIDHLPDIRAAMKTPDGRALLLHLCDRAGRPLKHATTGGGASQSPGDRGLCVRQGTGGAWRWDDRTGKWTTPGGKTGGDAIDLWQTIHGGTRAQAIKAVAGELGIAGAPAPQQMAVLAARRALAAEEEAASAEKESRRRARNARALEAYQRDGRQGAAERAARLYLTKTRQIPEPPEGWPASIVWQARADEYDHPEHIRNKRGGLPRPPMLIFLAEDAHGRIVGAQRVALTAEGLTAWACKRMGRGNPGAGVVWIRRPDGMDALALTEGVEDGLALDHLARAAGQRLAVAATLGTTGAREILTAWQRTGTPGGLPILAAFDQDAPGRKAARAIVRGFFEQARPALSFLPPPALGATDWNAVLQRANPDPGAPGIVEGAIRRRLARLTQMAAAFQDRRRGAPGFPVARDPDDYQAKMTAATKTLGEEIRAFFKDVDAWDRRRRAAEIAASTKPKANAEQPPTRLNRTTLGGGKTATTMEHLAHWAKTRAADGSARRVLCCFARFEMAREAFETFRALPHAEGIAVALIGGRAQPNTFHPQGPMNGALCVQPKTASSLGGGHGDTRQSVRAQLCKGCDFFDECQTRHGATAQDPGTPGGYLAQGEIVDHIAKNGGVVFTTSDYLHGDLPGPAGDDRADASASSFTSGFHPHVTILDERPERMTRGIVLGPREWATLADGKAYDENRMPAHHDPIPRAAWMWSTGWDPRNKNAPTSPPSTGSRREGVEVESRMYAIRRALANLRAILEAEGPTPSIPGARRNIGAEARRAVLDLFKGESGKPLHYLRQAIASLEERDPKAPPIGATSDAQADEQQAKTLRTYAEDRGVYSWRAFTGLLAALRRAEARARRRTRAGLAPMDDPGAWVEIIATPGAPNAAPSIIIRTAEIRLDEAGGALWKRVRRAPILALDATGDAEILAALFRREKIQDRAVDFPRHPGTTLDGDTGEGWSKRRTIYDAKRRKEAQAEIVALATNLIRRHGAPVAIIGTAEQIAKVFLPALTGAGFKESKKPGDGGDFRAGHYNAIRGSNAFQDCQSGIIVGVEIGPAGGLGLIEAKGADQRGPFISPTFGIEPEARALAAALGRPFTPADAEDWGKAWACVGPAGANRPAIFENKARETGRPRRYLWSTWRHFLDGSRVRHIEPRHPDPLARAVLWQRVHAEIVQALHRVRQVRNPRALVVLNGLALPEHYARDLGPSSQWASRWGIGGAPAPAATHSAPQGKTEAA